MLMFLRCLQFSYSGGLIQKSGGCWQDLRLQPDSSQPNGLRRTEGLGFRHTMETYGYAWFLDKVDWETLTFKQPHAAFMMFNNPSMQAAYHARYRQVRDVRMDFIRVDKARQWMIEFGSLCLCAFRKDVFTYIKSVLHLDHIEAALAGEIPLCYESVHDALAERHRPPQLAYGNRLVVKNIDVLFAWLWEWKYGHFERKGWKDTPYRMLFQQSFQAVKTTRGIDGARKWRQELKRSFFKSHWMLPYPQSQGFMRKDKETKEVVWCPSFHRGLNSYYIRLQQLEAINATLGGKDAFALMPTGSGKSLCYQLPAVIQTGKTQSITIVVSPLLSLMQDQVNHMKALGIQAIAFNGKYSAEYKRQVMTAFEKRSPEDYIELLYITPEMVSKNTTFNNRLQTLHHKGKLTRIIINKAHCISQ
ncbi:hypothetical protein FOMG_17025 [Fusarium oxysporum f. sp. melonis 26406]|uniref:Helicase ATP-binding domain-containing protein n=1 Tax=Fusarium oxysporum f. sp. melonis 26406 TaxID=1089452 RepID=W9ZCU4_FUSOX|nr:hypothetical protein FOMG_17025 [Fusarium oxysporum f. sp. melonis 26406]